MIGTDSPSLDIDQHHRDAALQASGTLSPADGTDVGWPLFLADAQGRYLDVNEAGAAMLGYSPTEICSLGIADVIDPSEIPRIDPEVGRHDP